MLILEGAQPEVTAVGFHFDLTRFLEGGSMPTRLTASMVPTKEVLASWDIAKLNGPIAVSRTLDRSKPSKSASFGDIPQKGMADTVQYHQSDG
jgi:hypothetical protein